MRFGLPVDTPLSYAKAITLPSRPSRLLSNKGEMCEQTINHCLKLVLPVSLTTQTKYKEEQLNDCGFSCHKNTKDWKNPLVWRRKVGWSSCGFKFGIKPSKKPSLKYRTARLNNSSNWTNSPKMKKIYP